jgi:hypothetical protein
MGRFFWESYGTVQLINYTCKLQCVVTLRQMVHAQRGAEFAWPSMVNSIKAVHTINSSSHLPQICRTTNTECVSCKLSNIQEIWVFCRKIPGADKSLARPGRKQARKQVGDAHDFNKIETRAVIKFLFLQGKAPKEIHAILTETLAWFLPGRAKDLSAPLYKQLGQSQWPLGRKLKSAAARLLGLRVHIPPGAWMFVSYQCCVLSGLCEGPITHPEESYRVWICFWVW